MTGCLPGTDHEAFINYFIPKSRNYFGLIRADCRFGENMQEVVRGVMTSSHIPCDYLYNCEQIYKNGVRVVDKN